MCCLTVKDFRPAGPGVPVDPSCSPCRSSQSQCDQDTSVPERAERQPARSGPTSDGSTFAAGRSDLPNHLRSTGPKSSRPEITSRSIRHRSSSVWPSSRIGLFGLERSRRVGLVVDYHIRDLWASGNDRPTHLSSQGPDCVRVQRPTPFFVCPGLAQPVTRLP